MLLFFYYVQSIAPGNSIIDFLGEIFIRVYLTILLSGVGVYEANRESVISCLCMIIVLGACFGVLKGNNKFKKL